MEKKVGRKKDKLKQKRKGMRKKKEAERKEIEILCGRKEKVDGHGVAIVGASGYPLEPIPMYQKILCPCFLYPPLTISSLHTTTFWTANIPLYNTLENLNLRWCFPKIDVKKHTSSLSSSFLSCCSLLYLLVLVLFHLSFLHTFFFFIDFSLFVFYAHLVLNETGFQLSLALARVCAGLRSSLTLYL